MVQNIHQEATQGRLLCNFDARESEASLILDIIETTRATRSSNPVVVGPLKARILQLVCITNHINLLYRKIGALRRAGPSS